MPVVVGTVGLTLRTPLLGVVAGTTFVNVGLKPTVDFRPLKGTLRIGRPAFTSRAATTVATMLRGISGLLLVLRIGATHQ